MLEKIMDSVVLDSIRPDFVKGKIRIPEGVDWKVLKDEISEYFFEVHKMGDFITYEGPWLPF